MRNASLRIAVAAGLVLFAGAAALLPRAAAQVQVAANYVPIGVAASGSSSTAWF